eukprot:m.87694 g.87694  ORF g.87694 m.87694 type:complete len:845 (+) comp13126_c1_seq1:244-2778(+)
MSTIDSDPTEWSIQLVTEWLTKVAKQPPHVCRNFVANSIDGPVLTAMLKLPDVDSQLEQLGLDAPSERGAFKRKLRNLMEASENHKASLDELQKLFDQLDRAELSAALKEHGTLEAATHVLMETHFPSASPDSSPKRSSSVSGPTSPSKPSQFYPLFPEIGHTTIDAAFAKANGDEEMIIDHLLTLQTIAEDPSESLPSESSNGFASTTRNGFDDADIYDELPSVAGSDGYAEARHDPEPLYQEVQPYTKDGGSGEPLYMELSLVSTDASGGLISDMRDCLDGVVVPEGKYIAPAALASDEPSTGSRLEGLEKMFPDLAPEIIRTELLKADGSIIDAHAALERIASSGTAITFSPKRALVTPDADYITVEEMQRARAASKNETTKVAAYENVVLGPPKKPDVPNRDGKPEIKMIKAIDEILESEQTYLQDIRTLVSLFIRPVYKFASSHGHAQLLHPTFDRPLVDKMYSSVSKLITDSTELMADLQPIIRHHDCVSLATKMLEWCPKLQRSFYMYCGTCFHLQQSLTEPTKDMRAILEQASKNPKARSLPITSFLIVPIQRVARYPLLLKAILSRCSAASDKEALETALKSLEDMTVACNNRLSALECRQTLQKIDKDLDFSRLEHKIPIVKENRMLVKRGSLKLLVLNDKGNKVLKSKRIEIILFTDMLVYGKPVIHNKAEKVLVYKQVHRSLVEASKLDATKIEVQILSDVEIVKLNLQADSEAETKRWLGVLAPKKHGKSESVYELWDCPQVRVMKNFNGSASKEGDTLSLRVGDKLDVLEKDRGWYRGVIVQTVYKTTRKREGWFPQSHVKELPSAHRQKKMFKARMQSVKKVSNEKMSK